jgi:hypothetical protein
MTRALKPSCAASLLALLAFAACGLGGADARELGSAPDAVVLGFSADGRYFAYEQFQNDEVSGEAVAAIDVIDSTTNRSAPGFPLGFLGIQKNGEFPQRVGDHAIVLDDDPETAPDVAALRAAVHEAAAKRLAELGIGAPARRLAGRAITDRTAATSPVSFVVWPMLPGPVPDLQPAYGVRAEVTPDDHERCAANEEVRDHAIVLAVDELASEGEAGPPRAGRRVETPWPAGDYECAASAVVTDVLVPALGGGEDEVVVLTLAVAWGPHAETARYFATFVPLPD